MKSAKAFWLKNVEEEFRKKEGRSLTMRFRPFYINLFQFGSIIANYQYYFLILIIFLMQ